MSETKFPLPFLAGLGLTQIIGYGTLYYSFSILVPDIATDIGWPEQWIFGVFSFALLLGGFFAPTAGKLSDRFGAGRVMTFGSVACALALAACAATTGPLTFALALTAMELASAFVLYSAAFVAIVQFGGGTPQRSIVHLTLIAGFASTLFWPLTSMLHEAMTWRMVLLVFAGLHVGLCLPIHAAVALRSRKQRSERRAEEGPVRGEPPRAGLAPAARSRVFLLMLAGFALQGFALSAILVHMVPLTSALGMGTAGLFVASLFGPAQVTSRLINMVFGGRLSQTWLAVIASGFVSVAIVALVTTSPWLPGAALFAILFGLGSGLTSIVVGTLPLELFGREGYGARLGWVSGARQIASALAPFGLAFAMVQTGVAPALFFSAAIAGGGVVAFLAIAMIMQAHAAASAAAGPLAEAGE